MSRDQVQLLVGTPLLRDPFHADRWDYTYNTSRNGIIDEQRTMTLYFKDDALVKAEGSAIEYAVEQIKAENANRASAAEESK
ncbi:lipoprotein, SmpA/OmlA family [Neisseria weaveri LMG 5135]|nr:lipoprotein, SmpA/OmlA family [Neisseria weaveri LMG 5135]EGV38356.1 lipoprotein, SmpA/OmlA family [Neisseria weaveri ATCC 51223]